MKVFHKSDMKNIFWSKVMATTKGFQEPVLPRITTLKEERKSERTCKSVQLNWLPSSFSPTATTPVDNRLTYCITTREVQKYDYFTPTPDQCAHALVLKNHDYSANLCFRHPVNRYVKVQYLMKGTLPSQTMLFPKLIDMTFYLIKIYIRQMKMTFPQLTNVNDTSSQI